MGYDHFVILTALEVKAPGMAMPVIMRLKMTPIVVLGAASVVVSAVPSVVSIVVLTTTREDREAWKNPNNMFSIFTLTAPFITRLIGGT